ncbi:hypothetical protein AAG906_021429 [Vitis piasezkii]
MSKTMHSTYGKRGRRAMTMEKSRAQSVMLVMRLDCEANVKLKSFRDMKKPPRALLSLIGIILFLRSFCFHTRLPLSKGSQTTNLIQEPVMERDSRPLLFKFNEVLELMLVCWVFMDNVMP